MNIAPSPSSSSPHASAGSPPSIDAWREVFESASGYADYLAKHATAEQRARWDASHARIRLTEEQQKLCGSFIRRMPVLVLSGAWCGDCVNQCPIFDHFASASKVIDVRFLDRDARPDIAAHLKVCGGQRVPVAMFLSEDWQPIMYYGDRTLAAYRAAAAAESGQACASGVAGPAADLLTAVVADWLREFERVQIILRLSGRLRQLHGD
jgi:thioredoxin-like negative regulator of GroEL